MDIVQRLNEALEASRAAVTAEQASEVAPRLVAVVAVVNEEAKHLDKESFMQQVLPLAKELLAEQKRMARLVEGELGFVASAKPQEPS